ncbi:aspartyl protease family protein [Polaribacter cellanae]|uniref:Aspartyl protease family protein n=1 Tax=Polaribacter cellanae TaxID=2818493 RepID=A0A975H7Z3_9FLAO|nr:aspartyl protease family protein [Polaribacter cellanae]QTE24031.1 aspartyl protease family protein [Polaribacter cellanae]
MKTTITTLLLTCLVSINIHTQVAEIPFKLKNATIYVKVKINNNTKANTFIFDTGATSDLIDATSAKELGLKANHKENVSGAGGTKSYDIILSQKLTLQQNIEIHNTNLVIADLTRLKEIDEGGFDGIIGYSLLKQYITKIDYVNKKILLYNKIKNVDIKGYKAINFEFGNGIPIPQFNVSIVLKNGESYTDKILFDSGAALTLLINTPYNKQHNINKKAGKSLISKSENLYGESISEVIAIESLNVAGYKLNDIPISIAHDKNGVSSYKNYLGILGSKIISRFNVILDYTTSTLYLKPNSSFNKTFDFPISGISLKKIDDDIIVNKVEKTSPAYKKGVRKGDKLIAINKNFSRNLKSYRSLLKKENNIVHLKLINLKGKTKKISFKLKRLL